MSYAILSARALAFVATATVAITAGATGQRSFVASNGSDLNACTLVQPCRGFATAVTNTNDGGEVIVLDSAGYGPVTITKSITIAAPAGIYAGISVAGGNGVTVNGAGITVTLRGLTINQLPGGVNGISFVQGNRLVVKDCDIGGDFMNAINVAAANSQVVVTSTTLHEADYGFFALGTITATLDGVHLDGNGYGVWADNGSHVTVANSVITGPGTRGATAVASSTGSSTLTVVRTVISGVSVGLAVGASGAGSTAKLFSDGNLITEATFAGFLYVGQGGNEFLYTRDNNSVGFAQSPVTGGALVSCCAH